MPLNRRPDTFIPLSHAELTSTGTGNVQTFAVPANAVGVMLTVATNPAKITFDGTAPSTTNGIAVPTGAYPLFLKVSPGVGLKFVSTIAGNSVVSALFVQ